MNPRLFDHYKRELQHMRQMGGEFAAEYPKIAGRLGLETLECSDPYVERLLEGFAFLAARVKLKIETSHSKLARHLLEMVYPDYLAPTPSMLIAELKPSLKEGSLDQGVTVERGTRMRSQPTPDEQTECDFRTAHDVTLWPVHIAGVRVLNSRSAIELAGIGVPKGVRSALAIRFEAKPEMMFSELPIDELSLYLTGSDNTGAALYEQLFRHTKAVAVVCDGRECRSPRKAPVLCRQGFEDDEALLPVSNRGFQGYRLVQEYFALPERFHFAKIKNLESRIRQCNSNSIELVFLFANNDQNISDLYSTLNFRLYCTPAINLFPKSADRIHLSQTSHEYHVLPDRTRPLDFEVYSVSDVEAFGTSQSESQSFYPYYSINEKRRTASSFFSISREPRLLSSNQKKRGPRSSYIGSEVFLSLVDASEAPYRTDLRQLAVKTFCTNRDLPIQMPVGKGETDFNLDIGAPVDSIRCIGGPTEPRPSRAQQRDAWQLVSNLSLNYLSLDDAADGDGQGAAAMLRQMLELYTDEKRTSDKRQLEGILSVRSQPVVRQRRYKNHIEVAHGIEISLRFDESAYEGTGAYLLGSVLERFFARYATVNSFTETVLESTQRDEIERWPVRLGVRQTI